MNAIEMWVPGYASEIEALSFMVRSAAAVSEPDGFGYQGTPETVAENDLINC